MENNNGIKDYSKETQRIIKKFQNLAISNLNRSANQLSNRWKSKEINIKEAKEYYKRSIEYKKTKNIRRLFFDIETYPNIAYVWKTGYKLQVPHNHIIKERGIICISYKWWNKDDVHTLVFNQKTKNDREILKKFIKIARTADEIVGHNSDRFDIRWLFGRCFYHGINCPSKFRSLDTYKKAKAQFNLNSYSLAYLASYLQLGETKNETGGFKLWVDCMNGDKKALIDMVNYCEQDVLLLEKVFNKMLGYIKPVTHHGAIKGHGKTSCPQCSSEKTFFKKKSTTPIGVVKIHMECQECNTYFDVSNKVFLNSL